MTRRMMMKRRGCEEVGSALALTGVDSRSRKPRNFRPYRASDDFQGGRPPLDCAPKPPCLSDF